MLLLMWLGGCSLVAVATVALSGGDRPWLGLAAVMAAQAAVLAGRAARLPSWATWPVAIGCGAIGTVGLGGLELALYVAVTAVLLLVVDRFAELSVGLSTFCLPDGGAGTRTPGTTTLTDPVAREFAHARRQGLTLSVVSISVPHVRGTSRRLARIARALVPGLRRTDVIVRVATERLVLVLPGADEGVATGVLERVLPGNDIEVRVGLATFPEDGPTWASLRDVAQARERPWPAVRRPGAGVRPDPFLSQRPGLGRASRGSGTGDRPPVLYETRSLKVHLRRAVDLLVLALVSPVFVPLITLLALIVKLDSPGPALVRIGRLGRDGRPFEIVKLRSMTSDAESQKEAIRHLNSLPWPDFKIADDPRVTRTGRWLRKYSLDELPQLYNVLRGEMTLVGPRPCSVSLADYELWQGERLDVTPGIAGRWQAEGRGSANFAARCRLDISQTQAGSIRVSFLMVVATVRSVLRSRGAL